MKQEKSSQFKPSDGIYFIIWAIVSFGAVVNLAFRSSGSNDLLLIFLASGIITSIIGFNILLRADDKPIIIPQRPEKIDENPPFELFNSRNGMTQTQF
jgi:hypothetical protein